MATALLVATTASQATLVTWNLSATFNDGGTASGSFAIDIEDEFIPVISTSSWDIETKAGTFIAADAEYTSALASASAPLVLASYYSKAVTGSPLLTFALPNPTDPSNPHKILRNLIFTLDDDLTEEGGTHLVDIAQSDECVSVNGIRFACRKVTSGSVTAISSVPEPSAVIFFAAGLMLLLRVALSRRSGEAVRET